MTCYYPLLGPFQGIVSSVTYSSLTHNQRTATDRRPRSHAVDLAVYRPSREGWLCLDRIPLPAEGDFTITSRDHGLGPGDLLLGVPLARETVLDLADPLLPLPYRKKVGR